MKCLLAFAVILLGTVALAEAEDDFTNHEANQKIIQYYEKAPDKWPKEQLLKVAICYAVEGKLPQAEELYMKVLIEKPDEPRALRGLGNCYVFKNNFEQASKLFEKGWLLGDAECLRQLAGVYLMMQKPEQIKPLLPDLIKNRDKSPDILNILLVYSLNAKPMDKETFSKALSGISDETLLKRPEVAKIAIIGLEKFGDIDRANKLRALLKVP